MNLSLFQAKPKAALAGPFFHSFLSLLPHQPCWLSQLLPTPGHSSIHPMSPAQALQPGPIWATLTQQRTCSEIPASLVCSMLSTASQSHSGLSYHLFSTQPSSVPSKDKATLKAIGTYVCPSSLTTHTAHSFMVLALAQLPYRSDFPIHSLLNFSYNRCSKERSVSVCSRL